MPATETPAVSRTEISMETIASYLRKGIKQGPTRRRRLLTAAAIVVAVLSLSDLLAGCGPPPRTPENIVVAASATMNEPDPILAAPDTALLRNAGSTSTDAAAFVVNPNSGQAHEVSLTPRRADGEVDYGPDRNNELAANVRQVEHLVGQEAATRPFDLLTMLAQAIRATAHPGTLLVLSSGLSTAGAFNLVQVGWGADPRKVAATLRHRGFLPRLTGWHVQFSGLGDTAGRQPALPLPQRTLLTRYWLAICQAAGAASCTVDAVTRPDPASRSTTPVPIVPVPRVLSVRGPHGTRTTVPADEFFAFNSARLLPGADAILSPLARQARARRMSITITGYASPDGGTPAYNLALSAKRAYAVKARLIDLGVPARQIVEAVGLGLDGKTRVACLRQGQLDEAICARFRRVVITLHSAQAATF
jgi:outer membrane protein OmpA-like peptidoglycan-associated protein